MQGALHKWTTWDKYFKYLKFSATLERFSLFLECFGEIYFLYEPSEVLLEYLSAKWCACFCFSIFKDHSFPCDVCNVCLDKQLEGRHSCWENSGHDGCCICIYIPYKFALSSCMPSKIKCEILAHKGLQTIHAMPGDYLASWNCKPMGQPDLLVSMMMNQDFPGKVTHCRKVFFIPIAQRSIEEDDAIISKVTKGKDKTSGQSGKTTKCAEEQNNELTESIRN